MSNQLGVQELASSPTFSIVNEYEAARGLVYHFDFYRIESPQEALDLGVEDYLYSGEFVFMEWPEKIASLLPNGATEIRITTNSNGSRTLIMGDGNG